jgi:hypothetical protein
MDYLDRAIENMFPIMSSFVTSSLPLFSEKKKKWSNCMEIVSMFKTSDAFSSVGGEM